ncbi:MAG: hypothetical protein GKR93_13320 [Gammaproteobacteria bacterium]|nr:hypothetical protein [Gammaproteobacteria bacterium]
MKLRKIAHRFAADVRKEGAGTHITRWFVPTDYELTNPFLLFDETKSDKIEEYAGGFPEHPHRGFEAITYMLSGSLKHNDSAGFSGHVGSLGAQWLCNASGLTHDEIPDQSDGLFWCMQLWINLPAKDKFSTPFYSETNAEQSPLLSDQTGIGIRVVAGSYAGHNADLPPKPRFSDPIYLDIVLQANADFSYSPPKHYTVLLFVVDGTIKVGDDESAVAGEVVLLDKAAQIVLRANQAARCLLMAGLPIDEKIAWHGPFVMNSEAELEQAFTDFARFGPFRADAGTGQNNE